MMEIFELSSNDNHKLIESMVERVGFLLTVTVHWRNTASPQDNIPLGQSRKRWQHRENISTFFSSLLGPYVKNCFFSNSGQKSVSARKYEAAGHGWMEFLYVRPTFSSCCMGLSKSSQKIRTRKHWTYSWFQAVMVMSLQF